VTARVRPPGVATALVVNALSRHLARRGWSDVDLARATGLTRVRVNRLKNRRARPTVGEALRIGRALGLRIEHVFSLASRTAR
jgi:plasmid maintenance system antidote protein VapI